MYSRAQQAAAPSSSSSSSSSSSWSSSLPHTGEFHQAPSSAHSRVPHGGATVSFSVPESSSPSLLTVSEFSAQLTFVSPGNRQTTVALWDLESGSVSYHQAEGEAAPVQRCGERQHRLLLKSESSSSSFSWAQSERVKGKTFVVLYFGFLSGINIHRVHGAVGTSWRDKAPVYRRNIVFCLIVPFVLAPG